MKRMIQRKTGIALLIGLALATCVLLLLSWLAEEVLEGDTQRFDEQVRVMVNRQAQPLLTETMRVVTYFGSTIVVSLLSVCGIVVLYLTKHRRAALLLLITMAGALVLNGVLKLSFHRARPAPFFGVAAPSSYSFPSGHALYSFCLFGTLAAIISRRVKKLWARGAVWVLAVLIVTLVGFSRIYLGVHYPSDVIAGYAAAFVWVMAVAVADRLFFNSSAGDKP